MTSSKQPGWADRVRPLSAAVLATLLVAGPAAAQPPVDERAALQPVPSTAPAALNATRYPLPWSGATAQQLMAGPDGKLWFVEPGSAALASFDPEARRFERIRLGADAGLDQLLVDGEGRIWLASDRADYIGVVDPGSDRVAKVTLARYPGLRVALLGRGERADTVWFSAADRPALGSLTAAGKMVELQPLPGLTSLPASLAVAGDDAVWLALADSNQVARFDPRSGALSTLSLPFRESRASQLLALGERMAVIDRGRGTVGLLEPRSGAYLEYPAPLQGELLAVSDGRQQVWLVSTGRNAQLTRFDVGTRRFDTPRPVGVPVDGAAIVYDQHSGAVWVAGDGHLVQLPLDTAVR